MRIRNLPRAQWGWLVKVWLTPGVGRAWTHLQESSLTYPEMAVGWSLAWGYPLEHSTWPLHMVSASGPLGAVSQPGFQETHAEALPPRMTQPQKSHDIPSTIITNSSGGLVRHT